MDANAIATVSGQIYAVLLAQHGPSVSDEDREELHAMAIDDALALMAAVERRTAPAPQNQHGGFTRIMGRMRDEHVA